MYLKKMCLQLTYRDGRWAPCLCSSSSGLDTSRWALCVGNAVGVTCRSLDEKSPSKISSRSTWHQERCVISFTHSLDTNYSQHFLSYFRLFECITSLTIVSGWSAPTNPTWGWVEHIYIFVHWYFHLILFEYFSQRWMNHFDREIDKEIKTFLSALQNSVCFVHYNITF